MATRYRSRHFSPTAIGLAIGLTVGGGAWASLTIPGPDGPRPIARDAVPSQECPAGHADPAAATQAPTPTPTVKPEIDSTGCMKCHEDTEDPHTSPQDLTCVQCHGGNGRSDDIKLAHPKPRFPAAWPTSANPRISFTLLNRENLEWIRFVNPGDLRVAEMVCGDCHSDYRRNVQKGPMTNSAQVYSTALYNNGSFPYKDAHFAENYSPHGQPQIIRTIPPPSAEETRLKGVLPTLFPLPRFEIAQSGSLFRPFERGGGPKSEVGNPNREDVPGQPDVTLTNRGFGTQASVDPVVLGAQKVRLNDPVTSFFGTNDSPGDFRSSGCSSCHVAYANDRDPVNSGAFAKFGNRGTYAGKDPMIANDEPGHPIRHKFVRSTVSSQCITCHVHNGNAFLNSYLGTMWWDHQTDGEHLWPKKQKNPSAAVLARVSSHNPEEAAAKGLWGDEKFLQALSEMNPKLKKAQFADYHGHGWVFQKVWKRDRKGRFLDAAGKLIPFNDPGLWEKGVHLKDIHLEKGMHCSDCHFSQDNHGSGKIYGDRRAAVEITCEDCHGTAEKRADLLADDAVTTGPAGGTKLANYNLTQWGDRWVRRDGKLYQRSATQEGVEWELVQTRDTIEPGNPHYNERSRLAKTIRKDGRTWGQTGPNLAHENSRMGCISCHSSWTTNCFGCHLSATVNTSKPMLHNEGDRSQVYPSYNPQVLRTDGYMLAVDGTVFGNRIAPARSSSAVAISVRNANRSILVNQAPTISAAGYNGNAFNTHAPHTVRGAESKQCTDCHVSKSGDNNAWMASLLMLGSNQVNFMGKYIYSARGPGGLAAVGVTERSEPQAVFGSHLHQLAYPDFFTRHTGRGGRLEEAHIRGQAPAYQGQLYGEYLLAAGGKSGFQVYDIANIGNKDFSQRIVTSPFSSAGQDLRLRMPDCTGLAIGSPAPLDPRRRQLPENEEQPVSPIFGHVFLTDRQEGLITADITTLVDGDPENNFLRRAATFDGGGVLRGARSVTLAGNYCYVVTDRALCVVDVRDPRRPRLVSTFDGPAVRDPRAVQIQFRYGFLIDADGLKVFDVGDPEKIRPIPSATLPIKDARGLYLARSYAYVAAGSEGLAIVDIERPEQPAVDRMFDAGGTLNDARDVKVGMVNVSLFAYVADGKNGLKVVELTSPETVPGNLGYSPRPEPRVVAHWPSSHPVIQISEGYRRDRAVDESGNQIAVFGRRGARPFNLAEQRRMYRLAAGTGEVFTVGDDPPGPPQQGENEGTASTPALVVLLPLAPLLWWRWRWGQRRAQVRGA